MMKTAKRSRSDPAGGHVSCLKAYKKLLDEGIDHRDRTRIEAHLEKCSSCRLAFQKALRVTRVLVNPGGDPAVPSEIELVALRNAIIGNVAEKEASRPAWRVFIKPVAAVASLAIIVLASWIWLRPADPEFGVKGARASTGEANLYAFCLNPANRSVSEIVEEGSCGRDRLLQFSYSSNGENSYLFLFGIHDGKLFWYHPAPPDRKSIPIKPGARDEILDGAVRLGVNHEPGRLCIYGLFTSRPIDREEIERCVMGPVEGPVEENIREVADHGQISRLCFSVTP
jgi:hypothetical protein